MENFKICIAGKNNIAVSILEYLLNAKKIAIDNIMVICNKSETGVNSWQRSLRYTAKKLGVKEVRLKDVYEIPDLLFLSLEFDQIIKPELFCSQMLYNIHFSLLPQYKGMYTSAVPILNGEQRSGVTFHEIHKGIDTGNIVIQEAFEIKEEDTARDLYLKYIKYGIETVKKALDLFLDGKYLLGSTPQDSKNSSYYSRNAIDYKNIVIDLCQTAQNIKNQVRAFSFREYQIPTILGKRVNCIKITENLSYEKPGTLLWSSVDRMRLSTIDYDITVYYDEFEEVMHLCKEGNYNKLLSIPNLVNYVNQQDDHGWTPLMVAVYNNYYDIVQLLLSEGADINLVNRNGTTLLMYAKEAYCKFKDPHLFELFIKMGLNLSQKDYYGKSLIDYCCKENILFIGKVYVGKRKSKYE